SAFLGKGCRVTGKLQFEGTVRIEGHVEGEISAQDALIVGESAVVNAQITGSSIVIHGRVTGDVTAQKRLEIRAPGKLFGNIATPSLVIHEGVVFEGQCAMGGPDALRTEGAIREARAIEAEAERLRAEHAAALDQTKSEAQRELQEIVRSAEAEQKRLVAEASAEAQRTLAEVQARVAEEVARTRRALRDEAAALARMVTEKVLGRPA